METVDDEVLEHSFKFLDKAKSDGKPFFLWLNPTRMHIVTHLSEKYQKLRTPQNGWSIHEAGMAQLDDIVGSVIKKLEDMGVAEETIVLFTTDNGTENFTWPDGGQTPFAGGKGTVMEGGFRVPAILRWPGKVPAGKVENGIISGLDWFPTFAAAAGDPNIALELKQGKQLGDTTFKVHLDGYNQTGPDHGQGAVEAPRDLVLRRRHARGGADRRLQVPVYRSTQRLVRRHRQAGYPDPGEPPARSLRANRNDRIRRVFSVVQV